MMRAALVQTDRYNRGAIAFHWTIAALVIVNLLIGLLHDSLLRGVAAAIPLHKSIGLTVLLLTIGRMLWRLAHRPPPLPPGMATWERGAAQATHLILYALMIVMPLTGWMLVSGAKVLHPISWFGLVAVPFLPVSHATAGMAHNAHGLLGYLMSALVLLHIAAALRHHLLLRDTVLARMIPGLAIRR